jgi:transposase
MRRDDICIYVSRENRARFEAMIADRNSPSKVVWRANIVLATADGLGTNAIMKLTGKSKPCVWRWQERYLEEGVDGLLHDKTRPPGKKPLSAAVKRKVLSKTAAETPPNATHWSVRSMARAVGISHTSVQRIWAEAGLKPHLVRRFQDIERPAVRGESDRCGRALPEPAGSGAGAICLPSPGGLSRAFLPAQRSGFCQRRQD